MTAFLKNVYQTFYSSSKKRGVSITKKRNFYYERKLTHSNSTNDGFLVSFSPFCLLVSNAISKEFSGLS